MNKAMQAIIKKDFQSVASNRRLFTSLLIVPLVLRTKYVRGSENT